MADRRSKLRFINPNSHFQFYGIYYFARFRNMQIDRLEIDIKTLLQNRQVPVSLNCTHVAAGKSTRVDAVFEALLGLRCRFVVSPEATK